MHYDLQSPQTEKVFCYGFKEFQEQKVNDNYFIAKYLNKDFFPIVLLDSGHEFVQKLSVFLVKVKKHLSAQTQIHN